MFVLTKDGRMRDWDKLTLGPVAGRLRASSPPTSMSASERRRARRRLGLLVDGLKAGGRRARLRVRRYRRRWC